MSLCSIFYRISRSRLVLLTNKRHQRDAVIVFSHRHLHDVGFFFVRTIDEQQVLHILARKVNCDQREKKSDSKCLYEELLLTTASSIIRPLHSMYIQKFICISLM
jgi:hypothetical protein